MAEPRITFVACLARFAACHKIVLRAGVNDTFDVECLDQIAKLAPALNHPEIESTCVYDFLFSYEELFPEAAAAADVATAVADLRRAGFDATAKRRSRAQMSDSVTAEEAELARVIAQNLAASGGLERLVEALNEAIELCAKQARLDRRVAAMQRLYGTTLANVLGA